MHYFNLIQIKFISIKQQRSRYWVRHYIDGQLYSRKFILIFSFNSHKVDDHSCPQGGNPDLQRFADLLGVTWDSALHNHSNCSPHKWNLPDLGSRTRNRKGMVTLGPCLAVALVAASRQWESRAEPSFQPEFGDFSGSHKKDELPAWCHLLLINSRRKGVITVFYKTIWALSWEWQTEVTFSILVWVMNLQTTLSIRIGTA